MAFFTRLDGSSICTVDQCEDIKASAIGLALTAPKVIDPTRTGPGEDRLLLAGLPQLVEVDAPASGLTHLEIGTNDWHSSDQLAQLDELVVRGGTDRLSEMFNDNSLELRQIDIRVLPLLFEFFANHSLMLGAGCLAPGVMQYTQDVVHSFQQAGTHLRAVIGNAIVDVELAVIALG